MELSRQDRFLATLERARQAPFYKERLKGHSAQGIEDLGGLPLTFKRDLKTRSHLDFLAVPREQVWHYHESFGTTGAPTCGWYTLADMEREIPVVSRWVEDFEPGSMVINRYPYAFPVPCQIVETAARLKGAGVVPCGQLNFNVSFGRTLRIIEKLAGNVLTCMPLEPIMLAEALRLQGGEPREAFASMRSICVAGRLLVPSMARRIEAEWGCPVRNLYGSTEGGPFATSVGDERLRLHDDAFLFEVLDPDTRQPVGDGETGVLTVTTLLRDAQPMIRYFTEDLVRLHHEPDGGRSITVLGRMSGDINWRGLSLTAYDIEETILSETERWHSPVFFIIVTERGFIVRMETRYPRSGGGDAARRIEERLGVPTRLELCAPGTLLNHVALQSEVYVYKPRLLADWRGNGPRIFNISGGLVDWWGDMDARRVMATARKWLEDRVYSWRLRLLK